VQLGNRPSGGVQRQGPSAARNRRGGVSGETASCSSIAVVASLETGDGGIAARNRRGGVSANREVDLVQLEIA
jgi:hypothetical protein